jgi:hypothetical protein
VPSRSQISFCLIFNIHAQKAYAGEAIMTSSPQGSPVPKKGGGAMSTAKGILIMILLLVLAGAGGYFFGTMQLVAPVRKVAPGTTGAVEMSTNTTGGAATSSASVSGTLKKDYWLQSKGEDRVGYAISISINGKPVGQISGPGREIEITKYLNSGNNQLLFQAKSLPMSQRDATYNWHKLTIDVMGGKKFGEKFTNGQSLAQYTRAVTDQQDYNDVVPLMIVEE